MRKTSWFALALVLTIGLLVKAQQPGAPPPTSSKQVPKKSKLEVMLEEALKNNPDIRIAEAKLREAQAMLYKARMDVMQRVSQSQADIEAAKAQLSLAEAKLARISQLQKKGFVDQRELQVARVEVEHAKAALARAEAAAGVLLGRAGRGLDGVKALAWAPDGRFLYSADAEGAVRIWDANTGKPMTARQIDDLARARKQALNKSVASKLKEALNKPVALETPEDTLSDTVRQLLPKGEGLIVRSKFPAGKEPTVALALARALPLGAALQLLQDSIDEDVEFVVREYGILIVPRRAVPPHATSVHEFWKSSEKK